MAITYQDFLEEKHSSIVTDDKLVNQTISDLLGVSVVSKKRIIADEVNEIYKVTLSDGRVVILRISHRENNPFEIEKWAIYECRLNGVPAPRIIGITSFIADNQIRWLNIEELIEGESFDELLNIYSVRSPEVEKWCRQVGEILSMIHDVKTLGVGRISEKHVGEFKSWEEVIDSKSKAKPYLEKIAKKENLPNGIIDKAFTILRTEIQFEPCLLHHDVSPKHFFIKSGKVIGVIDFENVWSGDPVADFAWWDFFRGESLPVELLVEGYSKKERIEEDFYKRLKIYKVYLGIEMLNWYTETVHESGLEIAKKQLLKELK